jgi:hypothetical protein
MPRPQHYQEYDDTVEVVPGVFVDAGESVTIVDDQGEVAHWTADEWQEDANAVTATVNAVILATKNGPNAVRQNLKPGKQGDALKHLIDQTHELVSN